MKNKNIIDSFKTVTLSTNEKKLILDKVLSKKKKKATTFNKLLPLALTILVIFLNVSSYKEDNTLMVARSFSEKLEFVYKGKCFEESDTLSDTKNLTSIGILSNIENEKLYNIPIYVNNNNDVILKLNDFYITFVEVNCFEKMKGSL